MSVVLAEQRYDREDGHSRDEAAGVCVVIQLRDQDKFPLVMKEAWRKAIGLVEFYTGSEGSPGLIIDTAVHNGTPSRRRSSSVADEGELEDAVDVHFDSQPALAIAGDRLIIVPCDLLARRLIDAIEQQQADGAGSDGRPT